jgi:hypothetical protein
MYYASQLSENFLTCYHAVILREDAVKCIVQDNFLKSLKFAASSIKMQWGVGVYRNIHPQVCSEYSV